MPAACARPFAAAAVAVAVIVPLFVNVPAMPRLFRMPAADASRAGAAGDDEKPPPIIPCAVAVMCPLFVSVEPEPTVLT